MTAAAPTTSMTDVPPPPGAGEPVLCPLCDYDLRGLTEPRCPECGYQFTWAELRDRVRTHPYLFEHHPERSARSLRRTFLGSLRPWRFWKEVRPTHEVRPRQLLLYWGLVAAVVLAPYLYVYGLVVVEWDGSGRNWRSAVQAPGQSWWRSWAVRKYGSVQAGLDAEAPVLPSPRVLWAALRWPAPLLFLGMVTLAWPWLTLAALLIFKASMNRAKVRAAHVLRCVVYSADATALAALVTLAYLGLAQLSPHVPATFRRGSSDRVDPMFVALVVMAGLLLVLTYRLWIAYRKYLRFPHALATVAASQVIVALLVLKVAVDWHVIQY